MHGLILQMSRRVFVVFRTSTSALAFLNAMYLLAWAGVLLFDSGGLYEIKAYAAFRSCPVWVLILLFGGIGAGLLSTLMYRSCRAAIFGGFLMLCAGLMWTGVAAAYAHTYPPLHPILALHPLLAFMDWLAGMFLIEAAKARRAARGK